MVNINSKFVTMYKIGYLEAEVPQELMNILRSETEEMEKNNFAGNIPYNNQLVGNIEREYILVKSVDRLDSYVSQLAHQYFKEYSGSNGRSFKLDTSNVWVNFQKKYEFNPPHSHSGELSFVIYVKIPYLLEDERNNPNVQHSKFKAAGMLNFLYVDQYYSGGITSFDVETDKNFEGKIILFASKLCHTVFPFYTSDGYRVSISGNIVSY